MSPLSPDQVNRFRTQGYVLPGTPMFSDTEFAELSSIFEEDLEKYSEDDLDLIHVRDPRLFAFLMHDAVLDLVESLIGPDIGLWSSHFISKPAQTGKETPWHEDAAYWRGRMDDWSSVLTIWLALDRVDIGNGCMRVIPRTHLAPFAEYEDADAATAVFARRIVPAAVNEDQAVHFELEPNHCSIHDSRIVHGAAANTSNRRRAGYTMRYFSTRSRVLGGEDGVHPVWLARGSDRAGNALRPGPTRP